VLAATAAAAIAGPAQAQDMSEERPFSGFYVGASGGYDVQPNDDGQRVLFDRNLDGTYNDVVTNAIGLDVFSPPAGGFCNGRATGATAPTSPVTAGGCRNDKDGWSYYGRVGFDIQHGPFVVGAVGEFGKSEISDSATAFSTTPASYVLTREVNWEANARLRAGYAANTTLFYATGGAGYADIDHSFTTTNTANGFTLRGKDKRWGVVLGGGLEQKIGRNLSLGVEYLFHSYDDDDFRVRAGSNGSTPAANPFISAPNTTGTDFRRSDEQFRWSSMRATAAFRF
jgi:outer membrane immunogenic protein